VNREQVEAYLKRDRNAPRIIPMHPVQLVRLARLGMREAVEGMNALTSEQRANLETLERDAKDRATRAQGRP